MRIIKCGENVLMTEKQIWQEVMRNNILTHFLNCYSFKIFFVIPSLLTKQLNGVFLTWVHFILRAAAFNREQRWERSPPANVAWVRLCPGIICELSLLLHGRGFKSKRFHDLETAWKRHFASQPISRQTVFKSMRFRRLHDQWNRIVLKTLHFWICFQSDPVLITNSNRCRVNERCNRIETDAVTNETASV